LLFASATPIVAGATDRYRSIADELSPHHAEYERLNRLYEVSRHSYWISHPRTGSDIGVSVYDISSDGLGAMRSRVWDPSSEHDRWWLGFVHDVNGFDMTAESPHVAAPEQVWSWEQ